MHMYGNLTAVQHLPSEYVVFELRQFEPTAVESWSYSWKIIIFYNFNDISGA